MRKKALGVLMAALLCVSFGQTVFAETTNEVVELNSASTGTKTVTDSGGNKFKVSGSAAVTGSSASGTTKCVLASSKETTTAIAKRSRTAIVNIGLSLKDGSTDTVNAKVVTNATDFSITGSESYSKTITTYAGTHTFITSGVSWTGYTYPAY